MGSREPNTSVNPMLVKMAMAAGAAAMGTAQAAQISADSKEEYTDRLINVPGYIVLYPSGLILEWGRATVAGGAGIAQADMLKLTNGHFPWAFVAMQSSALAAGSAVSCSIKDLLIVGGQVSYRVDVRKQTGATTANQADGNIILWIAIGY